MTAVPVCVCVQILLRLSKLCVQEGASGKKSKKQQQRLLRNMGAHSVVLELLQIPYEKVRSWSLLTCSSNPIVNQIHRNTMCFVGSV